MEEPKVRATATLREMLRGPDPIVAPGAYDTLSAMLIERLGFKAVYFGGFATAAAIGTTEPMITLTEQAAVCAAAGKYVSIPMMCDGHTGFGDPVHVVRAVREFEAAGLAGVHIEDAVFPKRMHYFKGLKRQISKNDMVEKIKAAVSARRDPDFVIIARCETIGFAHSADSGANVRDAIERMEAYIEAGADGLMPMVFDPALVPVVRKAIPSNVPFLWAGGLGKVFGHGDPTPAQLADLGYKIVIYPMLALTGAVNALLDAFRPLATGGQVKYDHGAHSAAYFEIMDVIGMPQFYKIEAMTTERRGEGIPDDFLPAIGKAAS